MAGRGAKSPRNFLNVLAKCSNPQYIFRATLRTCVRVNMWIFPQRTRYYVMSVTIRWTEISRLSDIKMPIKMSTSIKNGMSSIR